MARIPTLWDFSNEMQRIYEKIREEGDDVRERGIEIDPVIKYNRGAYLVAYRFEESFVEGLEEISAKIATLVPALAYKKQDLHSSIISYGLDDNFQPDWGVIETLERSISESLENCFPAVLNYRQLIFNQFSVLLEGYLTDCYAHYYYQTVRNIVERCRKNGLNVDFPWGCHITLNRFTENRYPEQIHEFLDYMKKYKMPSFFLEMLDYLSIKCGNKLNVSKGVCFLSKQIDVGYCKVDENNFQFRVAHLFHL